jgi:hypothetical protein
MTAHKGSSRDLHFGRVYFRRVSVRYGHEAMIPASTKTKQRQSHGGIRNWVRFVNNQRLFFLTLYADLGLRGGSLSRSLDRSRSLPLRFGFARLSQPQAGAATVLVDELEAREGCRSISSGGHRRRSSRPEADYSCSRVCASRRAHRATADFPRPRSCVHVRLPQARRPSRGHDRRPASRW